MVFAREVEIAQRAGGFKEIEKGRDSWLRNFQPSRKQNLEKVTSK